MKKLYLERGTLILNLPIGDLSAMLLEQKRIIVHDDQNQHYRLQPGPHDVNEIADLLFATHIARSERELRG